MAAYGLYTHIQSNKRRSIALLIGLFVLVYVLVFAGALLAEALTVEAPIEYLLRAAEYDFIKALPFATGGAVLWIFIAYHFHQSMIDAVTGAAPGDAQGRAAALQHSRKSLHLARHPDADAARRRRRRAQRLRHRPKPEAIFHHRDARADERAQRPGTRSRARPRAHPYPQRRRAHDGDRGGDRRRDLVLRRAGLPAVLPGELLRRLRRPARAAAMANAKAAPASRSSSPSR